MHVEVSDTREVGSEAARGVDGQAAREVDSTTAALEVGRTAAVRSRQDSRITWVSRTATGGQPMIQAEETPDMVVGRETASGKQLTEWVATAPGTAGQSQCNETGGSTGYGSTGDGDSRPPIQLRLNCPEQRKKDCDGK